MQHRHEHRPTPALRSPPHPTPPATRAVHGMVAKSIRNTIRKRRTGKMGLLGRSNKRKAQSGGTTIIAAGSKLRGELSLECTLHIDGAVEGSISSTADISIGSAGSFEGNIIANHVVVSGYLHGQVECTRLEIVASGKVFGEVHSQEFVIEPGGQFIGESRIRDEGQVAALRHQLDSEALEDDSVDQPQLSDA